MRLHVMTAMFRKPAKDLGWARSTTGERRKWLDADPMVSDAARVGGVSNLDTLSHGWKICKDEEGNGYSLFFKNQQSGEKLSLCDMVRNAVSDGVGTPPKYPKRKAATGEHLLTIDLADVHFQKLAVKTETGFEYNREVARHRVIEGTKALLELAKPFEVGRILYVMGNDILHTDNAHRTTTSGTQQDTDGSIFESFRDAYAALINSIEQCAEVADVDLIPLHVKP